MKLTRFSHSCLRIDADGRTLVVDPGIWSEPEAIDGADAILVAHSHDDHVDTTLLDGISAEVFAPRGSDLGRVDFTPVDLAATNHWLTSECGATYEWLPAGSTVTITEAS